MALEILPCSDEHLDAAATLLADAHARDRTAEPLLRRSVDLLSSPSWPNRGWRPTRLGLDRAIP